MSRVITDEMLLAKAKAVIRECDKHLTSKHSDKQDFSNCCAMLKDELYSLITVLENKIKYEKNE